MIDIEGGIYLTEWLTQARFTGSEMAKRKKLVALSFDDGPHPNITPNVIGILNSNNTQGTFFWIVENAINLSRSNPTLFRNIVSQIKNNGHEIGLHAPNDIKPTFFSRLFGHFTKNELKKAKETLQDLTGVDVFLYRPHYVQLGPSIIYARDLGMTTVLGDVLNSVRPDKPADSQMGKVDRAKAGSILIFHDGQSVTQKKNYILDLLPQVIKRLKDNGLNLTSVSKVLRN